MIKSPLGFIKLIHNNWTQDPEAYPRGVQQLPQIQKRDRMSRLLQQRHVPPRLKTYINPRYSRIPVTRHYYYHHNSYS